MSVVTSRPKHLEAPSYRPLNLSEGSRAFRLLQHLPESAELGRPSFKFIHTSLDNPACPQYIYLRCNGYEIPQPTDKGEIIIDGNFIRISNLAANVFETFERGKHGPLHIYADMICHNLADEAEVAHHERLQKEIFAQSSAQGMLLDPNSHDSISKINSFENPCYTPLDESKREVRVLRLHASGGVEETPVVGDLHIRTVDELSDCYALSYVWGSPQHFKTINVNGKGFKVVTNLEAALKCLRQSSQDIFCWIDAICINQLDWTERSRQVMLMRDIYSSVKGVFAWLGPKYDHSDSVLAFLNKIGKTSLEVTVADLQLGNYPDQESQDIRRTLHDPNKARSLVSFYQREWWQRLWVLQEAVLAKNLILHCGKKTIEWKVFEKAYAKIDAFLRINRNGGHGVDEKLAGGILYLSLGASTIVVERGRHSHKEGRQERSDDILWYLSSLSDRYYKDPRDIVFSGLGLLGEGDLGIDIDYNKSPEDIYVETAKAILRGWKDIKMLSYCQLSPPQPSGEGTHTQTSLPSWVPDWRSRYRGLGSHGYRFSNKTYINPQHIYDAGGTSPSEHSVSSDGKELIVKGIMLDTIDLTIKDDGVPDSDYAKYSTIPRFYSLLHKLEKSVFLEKGMEESDNYLNGEELEYAFIRTLSSFDRYPLEQTTVDEYKAWRRLRSQAGEIPRPAGAPDAMDTIERSAKNSMASSAFIKTTKGYLGIASNVAMPGDIVCVLQTGEFPFLLRLKEGGKYSLVSDACE